MNNIVNILSGIGVLIGIYLFLSHGSETVKVISTISENAIDGIQVLQGRNSLITK